MPTCYECDGKLYVSAGSGVVHVDRDGNAIRVNHEALVRPDASRSTPPCKGDYPAYTADEMKVWSKEWKDHYESGANANETGVHPRDRKVKSVGYADPNPPAVLTDRDKAEKAAELRRQLAELEPAKAEQPAPAPTPQAATVGESA